MSLARLMQRVRDGLCDAKTQEPRNDQLRLATAAVLLDIAYADGNFAPSEGRDIVEYLQRAFDLDAEGARELIDAAADIRSKSIDHFAMTNFIRKNASVGERIEIVRTMWRVVYADGRLTDYENYLVRKLADLLGLEHHVMIDTKVGVLRELGMAT
jgi:uncharacterized tellurite resistance protein B-like protein